MLNYQTRNDLPSNAKAVSIAILNARLADAVDLALLTKQAHWNIKGPNFIALHEMIDGFRSELDTHVDTMAERVVQLGGTAQGAEQQSRKFAPADASTRTANEAFQICRPGAAVPFSPRSDQQPIPAITSLLPSTELPEPRNFRSGPKSAAWVANEIPNEHCQSSASGYLDPNKLSDNPAS